MPLYATQCKSCSRKDSVFRSIAERDSLPDCACGGMLFRILTPAYVRGEFEPYISPATGQLIDSRTKRHEEMTRHGFRTWEPGIDKDIARNRAEQQEKALKPIYDTVDATITALNTAGKLENTDV